MQEVIENQNETNNILHEEYTKVKTTGGIPSSRNLRYTENLYAQIKAIQRVFGIASEQKIIEEAVGVLYKLLVGVAPSEIVKQVKRQIDREQKLQRLQKILAQLKRFHSKKETVYPEFYKIGDFDWVKHLEDLQMLEKALRLNLDEPIVMPDFSDLEFFEYKYRIVGYEPLKSYEGKLALINEEIRLVEEVIEILRDLST
ncbi:MAG: hypothetical protein QXQ94_10190 [Candidatus Bathyarchaeia archaeon]